MPKTVILIIIFAIVILAFIGYFLLFLHREATVCFNPPAGACYAAEIAQTPAQTALGLMFRKSLVEKSGMLFVFENEGIYPFWMKNTLIPLDIIWISKDNEVVFISENNQPCGQDNCPQIIPEAKAKYVLELNAGQTAKTGIKAGDSLELKIGN